MGFLFMMLALLCLAVKGYSGKKTSGCVSEFSDVLMFNLARLALCLVIGAAVLIAGGSVGQLAVDGGMAALCLAAGVTNSGFLVGWLLAVRRNSMTTVDVSLTLASSIPAVLCMVLYGDPISLKKAVGFLLIVLAAFLMGGYNRKLKGGPGAAGVLLVVLAALCDGLSSFTQQLYMKYYGDPSSALFSGRLYAKSVYQFYLYLSAALTLGMIYLAVVFHKRAKGEKGDGHPFAVLKKPFPHILVMAVCLYGVTWFQTAATTDWGISPQVLYPVCKGGCLILVNIMAAVFFGEKPTKLSVAGTLTALVGTVLINLL